MNSLTSALEHRRRVLSMELASTIAKTVRVVVNEGDAPPRGPRYMLLNRIIDQLNDEVYQNADPS